MKKITIITLTFFLIMGLSLQTIHANSHEKMGRLVSRSGATGASILSSDRYHSIHTPENVVSFRSPDGSWQEGLRCGTPHPTAEEAERIRREINQRLSTMQPDPNRDLEAAAQVTIKVAFHVVRRNDGTANVTNTQIQNQLNVLNAAYAGYGFQFTLDSTDRTNNTAWSTHTPGSPEEAAMKNALAIDPATTLNVYLCDLGGGLLGYATFPWMYPESSKMHGVVLLYSSVPGGSAFPYNEGDTGTHEIGHYLGLYHPFQGGCITPNDEIDDTPQEATPASGCPTGRDSCPSDPGNDPIKNYMDYSDDSCMDRFTSQQATRMYTYVTAYKPIIAGVSPAGCRRILLSEGFENVASLPAKGWVQTNNSNPLGLTDWFQGSSALIAHEGYFDEYIGANFNNTAGVGTISNWLITPVLNFENIEEVSFWTRTISHSYIWPDRLEVRLSTSGSSTNVGTTAASVGDFNTLLETINPGLTQTGYPEVWTEYVYDSLPATGTGRIAFRYYVTNGGPSGANSDFIGIDTVEVCGKDLGIVIVPSIFMLDVP